MQASGRPATTTSTDGPAGRALGDPSESYQVVPGNIV